MEEQLPLGTPDSSSALTRFGLARPPPLGQVGGGGREEGGERKEERGGTRTGERRERVRDEEGIGWVSTISRDLKSIPTGFGAPSTFGAKTISQAA